MIQNTSMIERSLANTLLDSLSRFPVVGLMGARQVGKTTLARDLVTHLAGGSVYLDLERPSDLAKLNEAELYLEMHAGELVILDEVHRKPDLFPVLRALVDADRRNGRFLVLGSASLEMIRQSSESLAGRIIYHELAPFALQEVGNADDDIRRLWSRGGFPMSYLAPSDKDSFMWREAFIRTYLERDIPSLGLRIPSTVLGRFWQMVAHSHGQLWNASKIASGLGVKGHAVRHYLDILQETFLVRQLLPFHANLKKRLVKAPKVYLRDSGLLHALLGLQSIDDLMGHPSVGSSWEGWVIEQILSMTPSQWKASFYRTSAGAEIDLVLSPPGNRSPIAFEIKFSSDPKPERGFWSGIADLGCTEAYVICPTTESYPLDRNVHTLPVRVLPRFLAEKTCNGP